MLTFHHATLPNGLDVVCESSPTAESVALGFMVNTGARDEPPEMAGVSHFLEHMLFKGTPRRSCEQINREFDDLGSRNNAFTSNEVTCAWINVLPEYTRQALNLLADMMRPSLRQEDFDLEKQVILEEIAQYMDRPSHLIFEWAMANHFGRHPMARSVLGTHESISALTLGQMRGYFDRQYSPANVVLAVSGKIDPTTFLGWARDACAAWPAVPVRRDYPAPSYAAKRQHRTDPRLHRHYIAMLCPGPAAQDDARYAAQVLSDVLGDQEGSRLFWALIDPGLADEIELSYFPHDRIGSYLIYASCDPERAGQVEEILLNEVTQVLRDGLTDEEVERSKNKIETATVLQGEVPLGRFRSLAGRWLYTREYRTLEEDLAKLESIGRRDLQDVARQYPFAPLTITTLGPAAE